MTVFLLMCVLLYEWLMYRPVNWKEIICYLSVTVLSLPLVYYVPQSFAILSLLVYGYHHSLFLKDEKGFGVLLAGISCFLFICGFRYLDISLITSFLLFVLLEYISERILKREENRTVVYQNRLLKQQMDEVQNIYLTMRGWRHDYHNHLQALKSYLALGKTDAMVKYLNDLESELDSIDTQYHTGNLNVDAILNSKLSIAEKDEIRIKCDATVPPVLSVSELDLCVILGNLLDNAMESCRKLENKEERFIRVYVGVLKKQLYISVTNATSESVKMRTDTYFTTKRGDHGFGLKRVDNCVKKYDGYLNRQNEPGVFATEILLPL